jgi:hypothetical protein
MRQQLYIYLLLISCIVNAQQLAFPTAYGAGAYTTGGRGGTVLHVTNLDWNSSPGSLKWALEENYPRIIVFDVSGIINVTETLHWGARGDVTIAGQTAPEGGITLYGDQIGFDEEDNIIIRYIKFRKPGSTSVYDWCINIRQSTNIIVDHCSFAYSEEKALGIGVFGDFPTGNVTVQNSLWNECKTGLQLGTSDEGNYNLGNYSVLNNVFSNVGWRCPGKIGGALHVDFINNAIHNWRLNPIRGDADDWTLNLIGNYFQSNYWVFQESNTLPKMSIRSYSETNPNPTLYDEDNEWTPYLGEEFKEVGYPADPSLMWQEFTGSTDVINPNWWVSSRLPITGAGTIAEPTILLSSQVLDSLLPIAGANKYLNADGTVGTYRDPIDTTAVYNFENNIGYSYSANWGTAAAGLPTMPSNTRPAGYDTDDDGIPDTYETAQGWNVNVANNNVVDASGYTQLELFLNEVDGDVATPVPDTENPTTPSNSSITNITNTGATVSWNASTDNVGVVGYYIRDGATLISNITGGTAYNFSGLTKNTSYTFEITAYDAAGNESAALGIGFTTANNSEAQTPRQNGKVSRSRRKIIISY